MPPAAFRRSFELVARIPAGIERITVAVDRIKKLREIPDRTQRANSVS